MPTHCDVLVIGGGAAGFFAAIGCKRENPSLSVCILEQGKQVLAKVKISGGGRCNVTHHCFDPKALSQNYPRGAKELLGPFYRFQAKDTVEWFLNEGVELKTEADGRMFPKTNKSETIINTLVNGARELGIKICLESKVTSLSKEGNTFLVKLGEGSEVACTKVMIATGSSRPGYQLVQSLGHSIEPLYPSLFTFNTPTSTLIDIPGVSVKEAKVSLPELKLSRVGPLLITHWGFSGPAVLKLSAFAAISLAKLDYKTRLEIDWLPRLDMETLRKLLITHLSAHKTKPISLIPKSLDLPKNLWKALLKAEQFNLEMPWGELSKKERETLILLLKKNQHQIKGKTTYKNEFVTCGGVKLSEVSFKTMESKIVPGLYLGGEVLNIDGITGGFNFQAAWTGGWLAGQALGRK